MGTGAVEARDAEGSVPVVHLHLKVVPGASRDDVVGRYGDRVKVRVSAPPESGKANQAVLALLGRALDVPASALAIVRGAGTPLKTVAVRGLDLAAVARRLERASS